MNRTKMEIQIAEWYLKMNGTKRALLMEIMDLMIDRPDRQ